MNSEIDAWNESFTRATQRLDTYNHQVNEFNAGLGPEYNAKAKAWNNWLNSYMTNKKSDIWFSDPEEKQPVTMAKLPNGQEVTVFLYTPEDYADNKEKYNKEHTVTQDNPYAGVMGGPSTTTKTIPAAFTLQDLATLYPGAGLAKRNPDTGEEDGYGMSINAAYPGDAPSGPVSPDISVPAPPSFTVTQERMLATGNDEDPVNHGVDFIGQKVNKTVDAFGGLLRKRV